MTTAVLPCAGTGTAESAQRFFAEARATFTGGPRPAALQRTLLIGNGERLCVRFDSAGVAEKLFPAFAHLPAAPLDMSAPDFTIDAWDAADTELAMPLPPWQTDDYGPDGQPRRDGWPWSLRARVNAASGVLNMVDAAQRTAICWMRDADCLLDYERGAPFALLFHWWHTLCPPPAASLAGAVVHAAAVGTPRDGALLLPGRSGSGKSTTALSCLAAGFQYLGDEYILLKSGGSEPRVVSLYSTGKMGSAMLAHFPALAVSVDHPARDAQEKALLMLTRGFSDQLVSDLPLRAVVLPRVHPDRTETRLVPASPVAALQALVPSTLAPFPRTGSESAALLAQLAAVTRRLPCYHLELGARADVTRTPHLLADLLSRLRREREVVSP